MIVITNPIPVENEIEKLHSLFAEGLSLLHIRKPEYDSGSLKRFLSQIAPRYRDRLVLHQHHYLAEDFGVERLHFSFEKAKILHLPVRLLKPISAISTSVHSISEFNELKQEMSYAFLSPVYPSISKAGYSSCTDHFESVKKRTNFTAELVALGGISNENIEKVLEAGFDNVGLLGAIWNEKCPVKNYKKCLKAAHSY